LAAKELTGLQPVSNIVSIEYGSPPAVSRWFDDYFTERDRRALPWLATFILLAFILAGPAFLLWLASLLPVDQLGNSGSSVHAHQILQVIAGTLGLTVAALVAPIVVRPSLIQLSQDGIRKIWMILGLVPLKGPLLTWSNVKSVSVLKRAGITDPRAYELVFACEDKSDGMKLLLGEIEGDEKRQALFDVIASRATNVDADVIDVLTPKRALSFTEVWLNALSAPPGRERLLPLDENMLLDTRYKIIRRLGAGGQGTVYLAEDLKESGNVVLKETILPVYADLITRKQALEDFYKEAFALESAQHPHIVKFRGSFVADHRAYLVLDFVDGITLSEAVARQGAFDPEKAKLYGIEMCDVLTALHSLSPPLIHRDFTPDNLMIAQNEKLVLIDFAVAVTGDKNSSDVAGKASYMAPEQFKGKPTAQSDVYSMGCTLYYVLTGTHPEPLNESWPMLLNDSIPQSLNDFVVRCTKLDAKERFQNAREAKEELARLQL